MPTHSQVLVLWRWQSTSDCLSRGESGRLPTSVSSEEAENRYPNLYQPRPHTPIFFCPTPRSQPILTVLQSTVSAGPAKKQARPLLPYMWVCSETRNSRRRVSETVSNLQTIISKEPFAHERLAYPRKPIQALQSNISSTPLSASL